jgi:hypothetical protein
MAGKINFHARVGLESLWTIEFSLAHCEGQEQPFYVFSFLGFKASE